MSVYEVIEVTGLCMAVAGSSGVVLVIVSDDLSPSIAVRCLSHVHTRRKRVVIVTVIISNILVTTQVMTFGDMIFHGPSLC